MDNNKKVIVCPLERWQEYSMYGLGMCHLVIQQRKENLRKYQHLIEYKPKELVKKDNA